MGPGRWRGAGDLWGGEIGLSHDFSQSTTAFVRASKGYKAGGFNLGIVDPEIREFAAEELWTLEAGVKLRLLTGDNRLFFSLSTFLKSALSVTLACSSSSDDDDGDQPTFIRAHKLVLAALPPHLRR